MKTPRLPRHVLFLTLGCLLMSGCSFTPKSRLSDNPALQRMEAAEMIGLWSGSSTEDNHRYASYQAINIRPDGSGELLITHVRKNGRYSVVGADFRLEGNPDRGWVARVVSPTVVISSNIHSDIMARYFAQGSYIRLVTTQQGVVMDRIFDNAVLYQRERTDPVASVAEIAAQKATEVLLAHGHSGQASPPNSGQLHAMTSAFQLGMGASALSNGNNAAAQLAFQSAQSSAMAGLQGKPYDANAAAQDAFRTGAAIGSNGASVPHAEKFPSWQKDTAPTPTEKDPESFGGNVTMDAQTMTAYTDGRAYDILVIVPRGQSAGEFCFMYGMTLGNARAQLVTSYSWTAEVSARGPGNPRQQISYRSYPVSVGQTFKVGAEFKPGQFVNKPPGYTAYGTTPLR